MKITLFALLLVLFLSQCKIEEKATKAGASFVNGIAVSADNHLSDTAALGKTLDHLLDSMVLNAIAKGDVALGASLAKLKSAENREFILNLVEDGLNKKINRAITDIKVNLLGGDTRQRLQQIIASVFDAIPQEQLKLAAADLGSSLTGTGLQNNVLQLGKTLRDSLLSEKTGLAVKMLVDSAAKAFFARANSDFIDRNLPVYKRYAGEFLAGAGVLTAIIALLIWRVKKRYEKTVTILASQIRSIDDRKIYNATTERIRRDATAAGVETTLRKVLADNGLLGERSWQTWKEKNDEAMKATN
jgi:hypothetical protein